MKPLTPKITEALLLWKTPRQRLLDKKLRSVHWRARSGLLRRGLIKLSWKPNTIDLIRGRYALTPAGKKVWEELQE